MTHPAEMTKARTVIEVELEWLEEHEVSDLPEQTRREWMAQHLAMCLDTAGFDVADRPESPVHGKGQPL